MFLLISPKNVFTTKRLLEEAQRAGFDMEVMDVHDLAKQSVVCGSQIAHSAVCRTEESNH
jgi:hypothetical protein